MGPRVRGDDALYGAFAFNEVPPIRSSHSQNTYRHCEPTGRANARPMTGSAKQSTAQQRRKSGLLRRSAPLRKRFAFVAGNGGKTQLRDLAAWFARGLACSFRPLQSIRGRRESRVPIAPVGPVQKKNGGRSTGSTGNIRLSLRDGLRLTSRS